MKLSVKILTLGITLSAASVGLAQEATKTPMIPERILIMPGQNPTKEMSVTWRADRKRGSYIEYLEATAGPRFEKNAKQIKATVSEAIETTGGQTAYYYTAKLDDLEPSVTYAYRVGNREGWSEWNHFQTPADYAADFKFVYMGDPQADLLNQWSRTVRDSFKKAPDAAFYLYTGDIINNANYDFQWGEWFDAMGWISRMVPVIAVPGNHETSYNQKENRRIQSRFWQPQFEFPRNGVSGLEDSNYYIDWQGVRIVALNSIDKIDEQAQWLDNVLSDHKGKWKILAFHYPIYSAAIKRDNKTLREKWLPIIDKHNVDLVLQGHDHTYGRSHLLSNNKIVKNYPDYGSVYTVSVSGPKMYDLTTATRGLMDRVAEDTQLYQVISVDNDRIDYRAYTTTGLLYDRFELTKDASGKKTLDVKEPEVDEIVRRKKR